MSAGASSGRRGWNTVVVLTATMALLLAAREFWTAPYGGVAIFVLPAYFVVCGVIAGRAVRTALRPRSRSLALASALVVGAAVTVGAAWTFDGTAGDDPLLVRLFPWAVGAGLLWVICADAASRRAAVATTLVATAMTLVALALDRPVEEVPRADRTPVSGRGDPSIGPADDSVSAAVGALESVVLPIDVEGLVAALGDMPPRLAGRPRLLDRADGEVLYGGDEEEPLFVVAMEAEDIGVGDETNSELLEIEARRPGRDVTARETDPSAPVLYVAGTQPTGPSHFLVWTSPDNPFVFAAGADSAENLALLVTAFAFAAR